jgi:aromatic-L-amino-acid decarboxylase
MSHNGELELSEEVMRKAVNATMDRIAHLVNTIEEQETDLSAEADPDFVRSFYESLPECGTSFESLLELLFGEASKYSLNTVSPGFMGYVPSGGLFHAALADLIGNSINRYVAIASVAPALSQIETAVIQWFAEITGLPSTTRGFLTSGGSTATLGAITTARTVLLGRDFLDGVMYASDQAHFCVAKAAFLAGIPIENVRKLPSDHLFRLQPETLREAIHEDRKAGLRPFFIVASAGTTNTGAVDPLHELADIAAEEKLWLHVDGAYGGLFSMTERGRKILSGIERADSLILDPHKTLFLPYGTGALLVRDGRALRKTYHANAEYLPDLQDSDGIVDFSEVSPELTRPFRALRVWLPMKVHGARVFRSYLDEKLDLARWVHTRLTDIDGIDVVARPELSILAFALSPDGRNLEEVNHATRSLIEAINARQRVCLTGTTIRGRFLIRIAIVAFRTHKDRVEMLLEDIVGCLADQINLDLAR